MELLQFMAAPVAMCVVLVGIHVQLGLHVVRRGVIFVDIALAQSSALGAAIGVAAGIEVGSTSSGAAGLAMALLVAWIISMTRGYGKRIPQEAFIGIIYVVTAAATILILTGLPHGSEEIENLLVGSILWVSWGDVARTTGLYTVIGVLLFLVRRPFRRITEDPAAAREDRLHVAGWDFLFYACLGVVVTWSVQIAGVFLVFTFLVVPAVMALLVARERQLLVGWVLGAGIAAAGAILSYLLDLPTGATIVCTFGVSLALLAIVNRRG